MRVFIFIFVIFASACSVQGSVIYSKGLISGWDHDGFKNVRGGVEILFSVENRDYIRLNENFAGITTKDRAGNIVSPVGRKPFIIKVEVKSDRDGFYIGQNAKLILADEGHYPSKVKTGVDRVLTGRESYDVERYDYMEFMKVDHTLEGIDHNWLWLEFDVETPHPSQLFSLYLNTKDGKSVEILTVHFNAQEINIYHH